MIQEMGNALLAFVIGMWIGCIFLVIGMVLSDKFDKWSRK